MRHPGLLFTALSLVWLTGCEEQAPPTVGTAVTAPSSGGEAPVVRTQVAPATPVQLLAAGDEVSLSLERGDGAYRLRDGKGEKVGKIKLEPDRVKVKDAAGNPLGKVKKKDDGFKVYAADDQVLFKVKVKEGKLKLKGPNDEELGQLKGGTLTWQGASITAKAEGDVVVVSGPSGPRSVRGLSAERALWLGVPGLSREQALAVIVFLDEVR